MRNRAILTLSLLFAATAVQAAITGSLMTPDGKPVAGATVTLSKWESSAEQRLRLVKGLPLTTVSTAESDAKGAFKIDAPKEPLLELRVNAAGHGPFLRRVTSDEELGAVTLWPAASKSGTVRAGGKPVAGARVVWLYDLADVVVTTDEQGRYSVPDPGATAGRRIVIHPDFALSNQMNTGGKGIPLDVTLDGGSAYGGRAVGPDGAAVADAVVLVDGWPLGRTGEDGTFTIPHLQKTWRSIIIHGGGLIGLRFSAGNSTPLFTLSKASRIAGTVTDAKSRLPIAGAVVQAGLDAMLGFEWQTTATDAKGRYEFTVPAARYRYSVSHPMYAGASLQQVDTLAGQTATRDRSLAPLALLSGHVLDDDRKPVVAAAIGQEQVRETFSGPPPAMMLARNLARSGPDGRFALRVPESEIRLTATKKGLPAGKSDPLKVAAGERKSGISIVVPRGHAVKGRVMTADNAPLGGVTIAAREAVNSNDPMAVRQMIMIGARQDLDDSVETAADGTFTIHLREGAHDLTFKREGWASNTVRGVAVSPSTPPVEVTMKPSLDISGRIVRNGVGIEGVMLYSFVMGSTPSQATTEADGSFVLRDLIEGPVRIELMKFDDFIRETRNIAAPASGVLIELPAGGKVSGRAIDKSTRAAITTFQAGVSVSRGGAGMQMVGPAQLRSFSSDDGSFTLEHVPAGVVSLVVNAPGYVAGRGGSVTVEEGKSVEGVVIELDRGARLVGRVTGPNGMPVAGVTVREAPPRGPAVMAMMGVTATTDGNGDYSIEAIETTEGDGPSKSFTFSHPDFVPVEKEAKITGREVRLDAQLSGGLGISGIVVTESGVPVADAFVRAQGGTFEQTRTDSGGAFRFDGLKEGRYTFNASKQGLAPGFARDIDVAGGQQVRITMSAGGTIYGRVSGLTPRELATATVNGYSGSGSGSVSSPVDSSGNYRLEGVPAGSVRLNAMVGNPGAGRVSPTVFIEIAAAESRQADIEFPAGSTITGRVTRAGAPLGSATVSFRPRRSDVQTSATALTNEQGVYTATGLLDGEYNVSVVDMQRLSPFGGTYKVSGSGTYDIDMKATSVRGRVVDGGGQPVSEARINLRSEGSEGPMAARMGMADSTGAFVVDWVVPGQYVATAEKEGYGTQTRTITVREGAPNDLEFSLSRTEGVRVKLVDARDGKPVQGGVSVRDASGRPIAGQAMRFGASAGDIQLFLEPGTYAASVWASGYASQTVTLTSPGTQTIAMRAGGTLEIKSSGTAPRRLKILDPSGGSGPFPPSITLPPGGTTLRNLAAGRYTLQILGEGDAVTSSVQVTVVEGQTATVNL